MRTFDKSIEVELDFEIGYEVSPSDRDVGIMCAYAEDVGVTRIWIMGTELVIKGMISPEFSKWANEQFQEEADELARDSEY